MFPRVAWFADNCIHRYFDIGKVAIVDCVSFHCPNLVDLQARSVCGNHQRGQPLGVGTGRVFPRENENVLGDMRRGGLWPVDDFVIADGFGFDAYATEVGTGPRFAECDGLEETSRGLAPITAYSSSLTAAQTYRRYGTDEQKKTIVAT